MECLQISDTQNELNIADLSIKEKVELKGKVNGGLEGQPVAVEIKDADGNVMLIRIVTSDENGDFVLKFKVPNNAKAGEFDIVTSVELDGQSFSETKSI